MGSYEFDTRDTDYECHVCMTSPSGHVRRKRFRNGYASARLSAKSWIASQIKDIETECKLSGRECPQIFVDGQQVVATDKPRLSECMELIAKFVEWSRKPDQVKVSLSKLLADSEKLIERYEQSQQGEVVPAK